MRGVRAWAASFAAAVLALGFATVAAHQAGATASENLVCNWGMSGTPDGAALVYFKVSCTAVSPAADFTVGSMNVTYGTAAPGTARLITTEVITGRHIVGQLNFAWPAGMQVYKICVYLSGGCAATGAYIDSGPVDTGQRNLSAATNGFFPEFPADPGSTTTTTAAPTTTTTAAPTTTTTAVSTTVTTSALSCDQHGGLYLNSSTTSTTVGATVQCVNVVTGDVGLPMWVMVGLALLVFLTAAGLVASWRRR